MVASQMTYKLIFPLKRLLTTEAHLRQQLNDVLIAQKIHAGFRLHCLHDKAVRFKLLFIELITNLECQVEVPKVLFKSMFRQEYLVARLTRKDSVSIGHISRRILAMEGHVDSILSQNNTIVFSKKMSATKFTRIAGAGIVKQVGIPSTMFLVAFIVRITPMSHESTCCQHVSTTQNTSMRKICSEVLPLTKCSVAHSLNIVQIFTDP